MRGVSFASSSAGFEHPARAQHRRVAPTGRPGTNCAATIVPKACIATEENARTADPPVAALDRIARRGPPGATVATAPIARSRNPLSMSLDPDLMTRLERIAAALERLAPPGRAKPDFAAAEAFVWQAEPEASCRSPTSTACRCRCCKGIDRARHSCSTIRAASPAACPPTTRCCGARAAWARSRSSRRCMPRCAGARPGKGSPT